MKLRYYIIRRILLVIPTLVGLTFIVFALTHVGGTQRLVGSYVNPHSSIPVSVQEAQVVARLHLQDPIPIQYIYWVIALLQGDWGSTLTPVYSGPVTTAISVFLPNTLVLAVFSSILVAVIGIPLGVWSAVRKDSLVDQATRVVSFIGYSMPVYWLALILIITFASSSVCSCLNVFPSTGTVSLVLVGGVSWYQGGISSPTHVLLIDSLLHGRIDVFFDAFLHLILPVAALTYGIMAGVLRVMRSSMQDVLGQDYIRTARAKGLPESMVINVHARRNALIPTVTLLGYTVASLLGGVVLVESVFNYLGIGYWTTQALLNGDIGGIMGATLVFGISFICANLVVDIIYAALDPRIHY